MYTKESIHEKLSNFISADKTEELCDLLKEHNGVISGSFVLQLLTGKNFVDSDLDIYVKEDYYTNNFPKSVFARFLIDDGYTIETSHNSPNQSRLISHITIFKKNNKKIDLIRGYPDNIILNFDLFCVMNYFDGESIYCLDYKGIINRTTIYFDCPGFNFYRKMFEETESVQIRDQIKESRIQKYSKRGFVIEIIDEKHKDQYIIPDFLHSEVTFKQIFPLRISKNIIEELNMIFDMPPNVDNRPIFKKGGIGFHESWEKICS